MVAHGVWVLCILRWVFSLETREREGDGQNVHSESKDRRGEMEKANRKEEWVHLRVGGFVFVFGFFYLFSFIYVFLDTKQNLTIYKL